MKLPRLYRTTGILALAALSVTFARADEPASAPAGVVGSVSLASADKVEALAKLAGVPLPPFATPEGIEGQFPFVGSGKFDTSAPISLKYLMGKNLPDGQQVVFIFPIKTGGGDLSKMPDLKKTDAADTLVDDRGCPYRNTGSYVMAGGTVPVTSKIDTAALAAAFKPSTTAEGKTVSPIARVTIDIKELKTTAADQFDKALSMSPGDEANPVSVALHDFVTEKLDRVDLGLDQVGDDYALSATMVPLHIDPAKFEKAGLPDDIVMRADMCLSADALTKLTESKQGSKMTPSDKAAAELFETIFLGDGESIGLSPAGGGTLFDVAHHPHAGDVKAKLQPIIDRLNTGTGADRMTAGLTEYTTGGMTIERITLTQAEDKSTIYIDVMVHGDTIYTAASVSDGHEVEKLMGLKPAGTTTSIASGWVDIVGTAKVARSITEKMSPKDPIPELPPNVADAIGNKPVYWSADNDGDGMKATIILPPSLIKSIGMLAKGG